MGALLNKLVAEAIATQEAAKLAAINGAKTNLDRLMAQGVIVTEDDAMDNAYRFEAQRQLAAVAGISLAEAGERMKLADVQRHVILALRAVVLDKETPDEGSARVADMFADIAGVTTSGKACTHKKTKRDGIRLMKMVCTRCGATGILYERATPSAGALHAAATLRALAEDETGAKRDALLACLVPDQHQLDVYRQVAAAFTGAA